MREHLCTCTLQQQQDGNGSHDDWCPAKVFVDWPETIVVLTIAVILGILFAPLIPWK